MTQNSLHNTPHSSLSRKAALAQTAIISSVVMIFSLAIIVFNTHRLTEQLENKIDEISVLAETSLTSAVWQVDHASARDFIDALLHDKTVAFAQVVTGSEVMATRTRPQFGMKPFEFFQHNSHFLVRTVEIRKYGDWIGTFNIAISTDLYRDEILIQLGGTLALALVLIITISQTTLYFSRKRLFIPLKRLEESAIAIADGDLDTPIDTSSPDELGNLARSIDDMRESVRHLISDLQKANTTLADHRNSLEVIVKTRTDELNRKNTSLNQALIDVQNSKQTAEIANRAKSQFLASMSHEIRTPMNAILGMADILAETELTADQARYVQVFKSAGENLLEILNDILDISKIEAGHLELETIFFSLSEMVERTCAVIEPKAKQKGLHFSLGIEQGVPDKLVGDPSRVRQVLINLLGNAIKFTEKGSVHLTISRVPSRSGGITLQFSTKDTGRGIPIDKLSTIFQSFTQADSSTTREYGGTGLGLAISKQLVQMMGGRIWAESAQGKGSTFHFTANFDTALQADSPQSASIQLPDQPQLPELSILMLEDSKYNAFVIQTYLKDSPCSLTIAENGVEGLEMIKQKKFDIILMDIQMPVMDGYEATRALREWEKQSDLPRTPVVAMTAHALLDEARRCIESGADMHLPKPVKKSTLFGIIHTLTQHACTNADHG